MGEKDKLECPRCGFDITKTSAEYFAGPHDVMHWPMFLMCSVGVIVTVAVSCYATLKLIKFLFF